MSTAAVQPATPEEIPPSSPAASPTMSTREVADYLGKSSRSLQNYTAAGKLPVSYVNGPSGKTAVYQRADVDRLKTELATPAARAVQPVPAGLSDSSTAPEGKATTALAKRSPAVGDQFQHFLAAVLEANPIRREKPWLTLAEAVEYSGLPAAYLLKRARNPQSAADVTFAINVGEGTKAHWRFSREALKKG